MNIYLIIMFAAVAAGFAIAASISIGAYKEYIGNDLIKKENSEKFLKGKFFVLVGYIAAKVFYAGIIFLMTRTISFDIEAVKMSLLVFGAAAFLTMLLQGIIIKKDTLAGALDNANQYSKVILKLGLTEAITVLALMYVLLSFR